MEFQPTSDISHHSSRLHPTSIVAALELRGLAVNEELIELYEWRNGTEAATGATLDDLHLVPGFYFRSLGDAITTYDSFVRSDRWDMAWLPLLANGGGDFLAVDCSKGQYLNGAVYHYRIEQASHPMEYRSIGAMLATFASAFEDCIFKVVPTGYLEMDDDAYALLAASCNPDAPWWND